MWCIILYYIAIIECPVSANVFPFRSAMDMSNVYRTNMMQPVRLGQPLPQSVQLLPRQRPVCGPVPFPGCEQPTTCVENRQLSALHNNYQRVCYTIRRWPDTARQMMPTPPVQRYPAMRPPVLRQMSPQTMITTRMVMLQPRSPRLLVPQTMATQTIQRPQSAYKPSSNYLTGSIYKQNMTIAPRFGTQNPRIPATPRLMQQVTPQAKLQSYFYPRVEHDYPLLMQLNNGTNNNKTNDNNKPSTAPPVNGPTQSTTSTMPPYPGGVKPDSDDNDEPFLLCPGGKAKCNKYIWTTKKKTHSKKTTKTLLLWTI